MDSIFVWTFSDVFGIAFVMFLLFVYTAGFFKGL